MLRDVHSAIVRLYPEPFVPTLWGRMEDTMPRHAKGLTAAFVEKVTKPGKYGDSANLYLRVRSKDAKCWGVQIRTPR